MTNPTYEVNHEKLSSLSISDLTGLITIYESHPTFHEEIVVAVLLSELNKRINDIIIF